MLLGLNQRIISLIDAQSDLFFKEHAFLMEGGPVVLAELSDEDKRRGDQLDRDFKAAIRAWNDYIEKLFPTPPPKQGERL